MGYSDVAEATVNDVARLTVRYRGAGIGGLLQPLGLKPMSTLRLAAEYFGEYGAEESLSMTWLPTRTSYRQHASRVGTVANRQGLQQLVVCADFSKVAELGSRMPIKIVSTDLSAHQRCGNDEKCWLRRIRAGSPERRSVV